MSPADSVLLEKWAREHDPEAFRELVGRYANMVYATARRILGDPAGAEDVTQDCFLKLVETPLRALNLPAWLHRVATNCSMSRLREDKRLRRLEKELAALPRPKEESSWKEVEAWVDQAIDELPEDLRFPIIRHFLKGETHKGIARRPGLSKSAVTYRIAKGIEEIQKYLRKRGIAAGASAIAVWLAAETVEAAPDALLASLGKMALAGSAAVGPAESISQALTPTKAAWIVTGILMNTKLVLSIASGALLIALAVFLVIFLREAPEKPHALPMMGRAGPPATSPVQPAVGEIPKENLPPAGQAPAEGKVKKEVASFAVVRGRVLDGENEPLPHAEVFLSLHPRATPGATTMPSNIFDPDYIRRSAWFSVMSDEEGRFVIEKIPGSDQAILSGFLEGHAGGRLWIDIEAGKEIEADLVLPEGKTIEGIVLGRDGKAVTDAVVSVLRAWNEKGSVDGSGFAATDGTGRFRMGIGIEAELIDLRVNSERSGQEFFFRVLTGEEARLAFPERAGVRGRVTWPDGKPAREILVCLTGQLPIPDPKGQVFSSGRGMKSYLDREADPDLDGTYKFQDLIPGVIYDAYVIPAAEREIAMPHSLTPQWDHRFELDPGEVKEIDLVVPKPIILSGHIVTERTRAPVPGYHVLVMKDGEPILDPGHPPDEKGSFRILINTGPGRYRVSAMPGPMLPSKEGDLIGERLGKDFDFQGGEELEVDLEVFEPIVVPIRVVDATGTPVRDIRSVVEITLPNGRDIGMGNSHSLDPDGRLELRFYVPLTELRLQVAALPQGPLTDAIKYTGEPGTVFPEKTVILDRTCDLLARFVAPGGKPHAEAMVVVIADYGEGRTEQFLGPTDKEGVFSAKGRLRAGHLVLEIRLDNVITSWWKSMPLDGPADGTLDLGTVELDDSP